MMTMIFVVRRILGGDQRVDFDAMVTAMTIIIHGHLCWALRAMRRSRWWWWWQRMVADVVHWYTTTPW